MPRQMTERERQDFLAEPHVAVLSVASESDRPPHTTQVWYAHGPGGDFTFFTGTQGRRSRKAGLIRKAGVLSLTVQREEFPYRYVTAECTVAGVDWPPPAEQVRAIARRYMSGEHAQGCARSELVQPSPEFVLFTVRPDRWFIFDFGDEAG